MDIRTQAREMAMQALNQLDVQGDGVFDNLEEFFSDQADDAEAVKLALKWTRGAWENVEACDGFITEAAVKWEVSRLSQIDKSVLRLATYQLRFCPDVPAKVVINEAIEIAKKYSSAQAPGFVNGVLDSIYKKLSGPAENKDVI